MRYYINTNSNVMGGEMVDQDITRIIELIDKKIRALTVTKQTLIDEFGNGQSTSLPLPFKTPVRLPKLIRTTPTEATRKDSIEKMLREHGPMTRKEIMDSSGFPQGTVAYVLNDSNRFISKDGKWYVKKEQEAKGAEAQES
jgi:hypothetical protein